LLIETSAEVTGDPDKSIDCPSGPQAPLVLKNAWPPGAGPALFASICTVAPTTPLIAVYEPLSLKVSEWITKPAGAVTVKVTYPT